MTIRRGAQLTLAIDEDAAHARQPRDGSGGAVDLRCADRARHVHVVDGDGRARHVYPRLLGERRDGRLVVERHPSEAPSSRPHGTSRIDVSSTAITIDDVDVSRAIRTPGIDRAAAAVARLPRVRAVLVDRQRQLGVGGGIVMEGRDIGTVVFPGADVKVYLDTYRRSEPAAVPSTPPTPESPRRCPRSPRSSPQRDGRDRTRTVSPLFAAKDAVHVDTTGKSVDEVVKEIIGGGIGENG